MNYKQLQRRKFELLLLMQDLEDNLKKANGDEEKKLILQEMKKVKEEIIKLIREIDKMEKKK